jgi:hypothetical protein
MLGIEARHKWSQEHPASDTVARRRVEGAIAAILLLASITLNGIGATSINALWWNVRPTNIDHDHARLWDWRHPQFLGAPATSTTPAPESAR